MPTADPVAERAADAARTVVERLLSLAAPPACFGCGGPSRPGDPLCPGCRRRLRWLGPDPVDCGGLPVWAPLAYEGAARALVAALKFRGALGLAETMAAQMAAGVPATFLLGASLVPVPLHPARSRRRGFNQAERLAASLGRRIGLPLADCLERGGPASRQTGRSRRERIASPASSIGVRGGSAAPARAVLVDDVVTTGSTLRACAVALRSAGSAEVRAVTYARTPGR
jgi:ComF family protein